MKKKKGVLIFLVVGFMAILLCLPAIVAAGGSPNPPAVAAGYKLLGPMLKGVLIVGWKEAETGSTYGTVEAFLFLEGKLYADIKGIDKPKSEFLATEPLDITTYEFPDQIVSDYDMGDPDLGSSAVVFDEKDVSNFQVIQDIQIDSSSGSLTYNHMLACDVRISFIVPKK